MQNNQLPNKTPIELTHNSNICFVLHLLPTNEAAKKQVVCTDLYVLKVYFHIDVYLGFLFQAKIKH